MGCGLALVRSRAACCGTRVIRAWPAPNRRGWTHQAGHAWLIIRVRWLVTTAPKATNV